MTKTDERYYLRHEASGEVWAVLEVGGRIVGVTGPLHYSDITADNLAEYGYEDEPSAGMLDDPSSWRLVEDEYYHAETGE